MFSFLLYYRHCFQFFYILDNVFNSFISKIIFLILLFQRQCLALRKYIAFTLPPPISGTLVNDFAQEHTASGDRQRTLHYFIDNLFNSFIS